MIYMIGSKCSYDHVSYWSLSPAMFGHLQKVYYTVVVDLVSAESVTVSLVLPKYVSSYVWSIHFVGCFFDAESLVWSWLVSLHFIDVV